MKWKLCKRRFCKSLICPGFNGRFDKVEIKQLIKKALCAREYAYAPYSEFRVGAAVLCSDGSVFTGANIENVSLGAANCAERTAIFKAVSEGKRSFEAIAVASGYGQAYLPMRNLQASISRV